MTLGLGCSGTMDTHQHRYAQKLFFNKNNVWYVWYVWYGEFMTNTEIQTCPSKYLCHCPRVYLRHLICVLYQDYGVPTGAWCRNHPLLSTWVKFNGMSLSWELPSTPAWHLTPWAIKKQCPTPIKE